MQRIIIFGGSGFIGSHTVKALEKDYEVIAPTHKEVDIVEDYKKIVDIIQKGDIVFNLVAVFDSDEIEECYDVNLGGALNILYAAIQKKAKKIIFSSTAQEVKDSIYFPRTTYFKTKINAETVYYCQEKIPIVILNYCNVYGEGDQKSVIFDILNTDFLGLSSESRDFIYIKDIVGINRIAIGLKHGRYYVGTGKLLSIKEADEIIREESGLRKHSRRFKSYPNPYRKDLSEIKGWKAKYSFREGIRDMLKGDD